MPFTLFVAVALSITAFPVLARILADRGLENTLLGAFALGCAAIDDALAWCPLTAVVALSTSGTFADSTERGGGPRMWATRGKPRTY
ncbi:cation:proton antiporter domain-containing protein [Microtetraspora malaysiensis]|uniref:cation:proton antiporter domain-containing protein n=1 Tax=Microtetraspora malaysiensis TaxID=161358 RepID=UPI003D930838